MHRTLGAADRPRAGSLRRSPLRGCGRLPAPRLARLPWPDPSMAPNHKLEDSRQAEEDCDDDGHPLDLVDLLALLHLLAGGFGDLSLELFLAFLVAGLADALGAEVD